MKYLFIDSWCDYSIITDFYRENQINSFFLSYATIIQRLNISVSCLDTKETDFTKEKLFSLIKKEKFEKIFFYVNIDNIHSLLRVQLNIKNTDIVFLSVNEDLSLMLANEKHIKYVNHDERFSFELNVNKFLKICNIMIDSNEVYYEIPLNYSLCKSLLKKTILLNVGTGCKGGCEFCTISNSQLIYRNIDNIMVEIKSLLSQGVKYFHIMNHSFSCDRFFIETFCMEIRKIAQDYDFYWSCYIIPSFFINHLDLFPIMVEAKLGKIEIGCESGSKNILEGFNLTHSNSDVEKIINEAINSKIPVVGCHFIIGSKNETYESLNETKDFIIKILELSYSLCDIYIHNYFPERDLHSKIYDQIIKKRRGFVSGSNCLSILELNKYKRILHKSINSKRKELVEKVPIKILHQHYQIKKYNITTQIFKKHIEKSLLMMLFKRKDADKNNIFFSWEIADSIDTYTPIYYDPTYIQLEELNEDYSNLNRIILYYLKEYITVKELIDITCKSTNNIINRNHILSFLNELENNKKLFYSKYLN